MLDAALEVRIGRKQIAQLFHALAFHDLFSLNDIVPGIPERANVIHGEWRDKVQQYQLASGLVGKINGIGKRL